MKTKPVYAKPNVLGVDLPENEIDSVLDVANRDPFATFRREWLASFFSIDQSELYKSCLLRYAKADIAMTNISFGSYQDDIHTRVIQSLASAKKCYSYAEYLACIELCALHGEMLVNFLCTSDRSILDGVIHLLKDNDRKHILDKQGKGAFFADEINQTTRIRWLLASGIIENKDKKALDKVHGMRINYFHRWHPGNKLLESDALNGLKTVSQVSAKYLELHDNRDNVNRIKRYMAAVDTDRHK